MRRLDCRVPAVRLVGVASAGSLRRLGRGVVNSPRPLTVRQRLARLALRRVRAGRGRLPARVRRRLVLVLLAAFGALLLPLLASGFDGPRALPVGVAFARVPLPVRHTLRLLVRSALSVRLLAALGVVGVGVRARLRGGVGLAAVLVVRDQAPLARPLTRLGGRVLLRAVLSAVASASWARRAGAGELAAEPLTLLLQALGHDALRLLPLLDLQLQPVLLPLVVAQQAVVELGPVGCAHHHVLVDRGRLAAGHSDTGWWGYGWCVRWVMDGGWVVGQALSLESVVWSLEPVVRSL